MIAAALATGVALLLATITFVRPTTLPGTPLDGRQTPTFILTDYRGVSFDLASLRGRPVVLAFLYANCPDVCRLTAAGLAETAQQLGDEANGVSFVAVTVDPAGDDPSTVRRFLARQGLAGRLTYLIGPPRELERVWAAYHVAAEPILHTDALYLLDGAGRQRALLRSDFDPAELAAALRALRREWL